ncbi:MAG: hypothetical protein ACW991_00735 [Candidatus Hodarchaeales archaeon]|jgi:hypothetical protein
MGNYFGFHNGDVVAKNLQAGQFTVSGGVIYTAITFPKQFHNTPRVTLAQISRLSGVEHYQTPLSGAPMLSGVTTAGFTIVINDYAWGEADDPAIASGATFDYFAMEYITKYR